MNRKANTIRLMIPLGFIAIVGYQLWLAWPTLFIHSIKWQRVINTQLSELLYAAKEHNVTAGLYLMGLSFIYGVLHSIGPGHGKLIVTTFLATHPTKFKHGLALTVISALMQAVVAVVLVTALLLIFNHSMRDVSARADYLISISLILMMLLGAAIIWNALRGIYRHYRNLNAHSECCGHHHVATAEEINQAMGWRAYVGIIVSIGIRPCTGAIMVLLFSNMIGIYWLGMMSAFLMAVGTAITTSTIALMTIFAKRMIHRYLVVGDSHNHLGKMVLQCVGGLLLLLFGWILYSTQLHMMAPVL